MAALWSAPFFRANKSDGADNNLRRLKNEYYIRRIRYDGPKKQILRFAQNDSSKYRTTVQVQNDSSKYRMTVQSTE